MQTNLPAMLSPYVIMAWVEWFSFYFALFWTYLTFAIAALELHQLTSRYV
jgi:hypothetical protein